MVGKHRGVELLDMHEAFDGGQVTVNKELDNEFGLESLRGVITVDVFVQIAMAHQQEISLFNDLLLGEVIKNAGTKRECSRSDAVAPVTETLVQWLK
jgi:hypothetical protein